jgi:hypothetical protein
MTPRRQATVVVLLAALTSLVPQPTCRAEALPGPDLDEAELNREFSMGVGYSQVMFSGSGNNVFDDLDAIHFNPTISFAPIQTVPQLRLGADLGITFSLEDVGGLISSGGNGLIIVGTADTSLMLFQPELNLSWRQPLGREDVGFFIEPGVAAGWTFGFFDVDNAAFHAAGGTGDPDEWDSTFTARAFLRIGMHSGGGIAGLETSYLRGGHLDFGDDNGGDLSEFYIGLFGALQF